MIRFFESLALSGRYHSPVTQSARVGKRVRMVSGKKPVKKSVLAKKKRPGAAKRVR